VELGEGPREAVDVVSPVFAVHGSAFRTMRGFR
jgi:hypothetical protein